MSDLLERLSRLTEKANQKQGERNAIKEQIRTTIRARASEKEALAYLQQGLAVAQLVAQQTQEQLEYQISEIANLCLTAIFDEPYKMSIQFDLQRGSISAKIQLTRNGRTVNPMESSGGGVVDVLAFALRLSLYTLQQPRTRNTIILDEPFRFLSADNQHKAGAVLKRLSQKLGIQFIMVTHEQSFIDVADKVFHVTQRKGISKVTAA